MSSPVNVLRYAAFATTSDGGNPAGVVLDASGLDEVEMLAIAADIGYSESAFVRATGDSSYHVRYFSPLAEVPFCGHATIATAVALAERDGTGQLLFSTKIGAIPVVTHRDLDGHVIARLTSVTPHVHLVEGGDLSEALDALGWTTEELDPALPPRVAYAGAYHLVLAAATRGRLAALDYDFERLAALMRATDWTTLQLVWREADAVFHSRNPFPVGGVVEDPATGAAAAAFGAYLVDLRAVTPPARLTIHQGADMGRPGRLYVDLAAGRPQVDVSGPAVPIKSPK
jgi:PhzF family phenazine biosynthesis protein